MSLSRLLNGPTPGSSGVSSPSAAAGPSEESAGASRSKRKRSSRPPAPTAFEDEDDGSSRRQSSRPSARPKRYADDEAEEMDPALNAGFGADGLPGLNGAGHDDGLDSEEENEELLKATAHIWREPLHNYILATHAKRQQLEKDLEMEEASRHFAVAARVHDMTEQRLVAMRERKAVRAVEVQLEREQQRRQEEEYAVRAEQEEEKRLAKEKDKEERLKKQRDAARKKREDDRAKKERDEEARRARTEEARLVKIAEAERRAALTPEEREAEDKVLAEKQQREREEALLKAREYGGEEEGRGARKRRRREDEDGGAFGNGFYAESYADFDDFDDEGNVIPARSKGKGRRASSASGLHDYPPGYPYHAGSLDANGKPFSYPTPTPPGAYQTAEGVWMDAHGQMLDPQPSYAHSSYDYVSDGQDLGINDDDEEEDVNGEKKPKRSRKAIEDLERRVWTQIAKRDIPKVARVAQQSASSRHFFSKRLSTIVAREARRASTRTKGVKDVQTRAKKVMREVMVFMKGNEKKERESRKKAEKEALEKTKKEEEVREAKRAARKLNFLITQTELYSHFIGSKIKTSEAEESADTAGEATPAAPPPQSASLLAAIAAGDAPADAELKALDFDVDDEANVAFHARRNAQAAVDAAKNAAAEFDAAAAAAKGGPAALAAPSRGADGLNFDSDDLNFQNPTSMNGDVQVKQPKLLAATLKEYQLKGLNWLANLYEQGINGILADEMGLGKTVQSISLMAYLAEVHDIWGPFLVIAPASTLHNWQQEITRFVPALKALPYWGNTKDRAVLRKFWNRKSLRYDKDAPFHILVTSYQLVVQDEKYFQGVKWQYMVLDEAQAIKSSSSARWKTLLGFRCRNRLLLTGTPIQNSMHELWALLHFIMPSLFDSHDEFSEWFSKDIEGNAEKNGAMNEHQLRRLHMILKPFMLRRIKKNVQNELGDKIEIDLYCDLTPRQKVMYRTLREHISITDLVSRASSLNDDDSVKRLMNLIMQFRKVCNHPELFERADVTAPLAFASFPQTANLVRDPEVLDVQYATRSVIEYTIPKMLYREGDMMQVAGENSRKGSDTLNLDRLMNIWQADYIHRSLKENDSTFAFSRGLKLGPAELSNSVTSHGIVRLGLALERDSEHRARHQYEILNGDAVTTGTVDLSIAQTSSNLPQDHTWRTLGLTPLSEIEENYRLSSRLARPDARFYMDRVVAPSINAVCSDRSFAYDQEVERFDPLFSAAIFGLPSQNSPTDIARFKQALPGFPAAGVLSTSSPAQLPFPPMQVPQLHKLILDSGKLAKLDKLLTELKAGGHRVLVYFQMTRMIDLMEEYLAFKQWSHLRLDGASTISERRDMVMDWQTKPDLFIFLLSTRAGGLGINLTAADSVIFYDSDWNPSNDAQAMDRAHRLGQTKQVTVYRLITKDTVDERIVQLARNKKLVQDAVVGSSSGAPTDGGAKTNEVVSLLLDDSELEEGLRQAELKRKRAEEKQKQDGQKGAKAREDGKKARQQAALEAANKPSPWALDDDEADSMGFFAAATDNKAALEDDEDMGSIGGSETPKKKPAAAPRKRKVELDEQGNPKKRKRRTKAEMEAARARGEK